MPEVAPLLGMSTSTVRMHLLHVFEKTETSCQHDLVRLVAASMSPLAQTEQYSVRKLGMS
jgi:DNA-binding CsgD family transcriptional regulator